MECEGLGCGSGSQGNCAGKFFSSGPVVGDAAQSPRVHESLLPIPGATDGRQTPPLPPASAPSILPEPCLPWEEPRRVRAKLGSPWVQGERPILTQTRPGCPAPCLCSCLLQL